MAADRHGRAWRVDNDPRRRPGDGFRVQGLRRFRRVVVDALASLPRRYASALVGAEIRIADVPPAPEPADDEVVLATFSRGVLTVYRRAAETRSESRGELEQVLIVAIAQAVARHLGDSDDVDDLFG